MEEILKKANELGLMIKGSEITQRLEEITKRLDQDNEAKKMVDEYIKLSQDLQRKETAGILIEDDENKKIQELSEKMSVNEIIKEYIATQNYFMNMMMQVQNVISDPKGEPIKESKIITPGSSGKIFTGI
ncbi:MAG: YlbF family regulator [Spirochaetota bacterium]